LGKTEDLQIICLDLNSAIIAHINKLAEQARTRHGYTIQLPRDPQAKWNAEAISYWNHFGKILGSPKKPLPIPATLDSVLSHAVVIRPQFAAHMQIFNANIVAQTLDLPPSQGFDLIVTTNMLVYYDRFQQALAMAN